MAHVKLKPGAEFVELGGERLRLLPDNGASASERRRAQAASLFLQYECEKLKA